MNRKQFLILVVALLVLGGVGIALFWQNIADYRASGAKIGAQAPAGVQARRCRASATARCQANVTLVRKENRWVVQEREGLSRRLQGDQRSHLKLVDLKVMQADPVGESLLPRVELVEPGKGEGAGTLIEMKDAAGKTLATLVLGKKVLKKDPGNPLPAAQDGVPAGRYVRVLSGKERVVVVSDPLNNAEALPGRWLDKDFFKAERIKTLDRDPRRRAALEHHARRRVGPVEIRGGGGDLDASARGGRGQCARPAQRERRCGRREAGRAGEARDRHGGNVRQPHLYAADLAAQVE